MLPEQPCDMVTVTQLPAMCESPEKKQTQVQLVWTSQSRDGRHRFSSAYPQCWAGLPVFITVEWLKYWKHKVFQKETRCNTLVTTWGWAPRARSVGATQGDGRGRQYQSWGFTYGREPELDPRKSMMKDKHEWADGEGQRAWSSGLEKAKQKGVGREQAGISLSFINQELRVT